MRGFVIAIAAAGLVLCACPPRLQPEPEPGTVRVESHPPGATLYVDGERRGRTPHAFSAHARGNAAEVRLTLEGHQEWRRRIAFLRDAQLAISVPLQRLGGAVSDTDGAALTVETQQPARLYVDGEETGRSTPLDANEALALTGGAHILEFETDDRALYRYRVTIESPGPHTLSIAVLGGPASGTAIAGFVRCWGCTPATPEPVAPAPHAAAGAEDAGSARVPAAPIDAGVPAAPTADAPVDPAIAALARHAETATTAAEIVAEAAPQATLYVRSDPPGAALTVDGEGRGETPIDLRDLDMARTYRIGLSLKGFREWKGIVNFGGEASKRVDVRLKPLRAIGAEGTAEEAEAEVAEGAVNAKVELAINTGSPAAVIVDGEATGLRTPLWPGKGLQLRPGVHKITFVTADDTHHTYEVTIPSGAQHSLTLVCQRPGGRPTGTVKARLVW